MVDFEYDPPSSKWHRYLVIAGIRAFSLGLWCGSCEFLFARLIDHVPRIGQGDLALDLEELSSSIEGILPGGEYLVIQRKFSPMKVIRGGPHDYFTVDRPKVWNHHRPIHDPGIDYFRGVTKTLSPEGKIFEFIVPFVSPEGLSPSNQHAAVRDAHAAVALSVLDVHRPAEMWKFLEDVSPPEGEYEHWCLTHFLLDGHHRIEAASRSHAEIDLIAFLAIGHGIATEEDYGQLEGLLV